jgi:hypothetical protein
MDLNLKLTLAIAGGLAGLAGFAGWRGARPPDPRRRPRLMPWRMIMLLAAAGFVFAAGHIVGLLKPAA